MEALPATMKQQMQQLIRLESSMIRDYKPEKYTGNTILFQSMQADYLSSQQWEPLSEKLIVYDIDADHYSIMRGESLIKMIDRIDEALNK